MRLPRRRLLAVLGVCTVSACVPDPTIHGVPTAASPSPEPTQPSHVADLTVRLVGVLAALPGQPDPFASGATAQVQAWLGRLRRLDPLTAGEPFFPEPTAPSPGDLSEAIAAAVAAASRCVEASGTQPERLLHLSILAGSTGLANTSLAPSPREAEPAPFEEMAQDELATRALTHVWALLQGIERGLGVIATDDPLRDGVLARREEVRFLRNEFLTTLGTRRPLQDAHYEFPAVVDADSFRSTWVTLELAVLDAVTALAAATPDPWRDRMTAQVGKVQAAGGGLPTWPGWVTP